MELKEKLLSSFMAFEERVDVQTELHDVRTSALKNFENKGFPTKKDEAWKYTSLNAILKNDFSVFPKNETAIEFRDVKKYFLHESTLTNWCLSTVFLVRIYLPRLTRE
jgi:Fe-S cluster assembly protein SufD